MWVKGLTLKKFRNYSEQVLAFHPAFNFIHGKNAQGKTNLLEAISYLSHLTSFRNAHRDQLIQMDAQESLVQAQVDHDGIEDQISIYLTQRGRAVKLNGKKPRLYQDYFGLVPVLLFEPRQVYLFRESPSQRRNFLNRLYFLFRPAEATTLRDYSKVLHQRNRLLKDGERRQMSDLLPIWNEQLVELGVRIIQWRCEWLDGLNQQVNAEYRAITGVDEGLSAHYVTSLCPDQVLQGGQNANLRELFFRRLKEVEGQEIYKRESLVGPHRDDFWMTLGGRDVGEVASQGENRSVVIALKIALVEMFRKQNGHPPILLLDDVSSELDSSRVEHLFRHLNATGGQVFITTTEGLKEEALFGERGRSFIVEDGNVHVLG